MSSLKLNPEEQDLLHAFEAGKFESKMTPERKQAIEEAAEQTFKKDKRINIRISGRDLTGIQRRAMEEGMPYQTLIASILHKYISGSLRDVSAEKDLHPAR